MGADGKLASQVAVTKDLDFFDRAIGKTGVTKSTFVHARAVIELIEGVEIDGDVAGGMASIVEAALGNAADKRHLAAFESDTDRAAGAGGLAFATAAAGFAMAAGFALAQAFAAMLGAGTGF